MVPGVYGVTGGPIATRVTNYGGRDVVGSNIAKDSFLQVDRPKARERKLAEFDANRQA